MKTIRVERADSGSDGAFRFIMTAGTKRWEKIVKPADLVAIVFADEVDEINTADKEKP